jgi:signal transduction histidine kinase
MVMRLNESIAAAGLAATGPPEREEGARLALEAAGAGTWEIAPLTGQHLLSARSRELLGIDGDEAISIQRLLAALHPGHRERWKDAVAEAVDAERSGEFRVELRTAGPPERWLVASGRAFFEGMCAVRVAGTLQDVTEQKRAEKERDVRLGQLGHDLRTPLSAISMGIQLVQREVPAKAEILAAMRLTVQRMDRLIDELLPSARSVPDEGIQDDGSSARGLGDES